MSKTYEKMAELISEQHPAVRARKARWNVGGGGWKAARKIQGDERELVDPISSPGEVAKAAKSMRSIFQPTRRGAGTRPATLRKLQNPRTVSDPLVKTLWPERFPPSNEPLQQAARQTVGDTRGPDPTAKYAPKPSWAQRAATTRKLSAQNASTEETGMNKIYERIAELILVEAKKKKLATITTQEKHPRTGNPIKVITDPNYPKGHALHRRTFGRHEDRDDDTGEDPVVGV